MQRSITDTYLKGAIKNILFLSIFGIGNYFVLTGTYKAKNEWTYEHIIASIAMTTVLAIALYLLIFFISIGGLLIGIVATLACMLGLAYLGDMIVRAINIADSTIDLSICVLGIVINLSQIIKFIQNVHYYRIARYIDTSSASLPEDQRSML